MASILQRLKKALQPHLDQRLVEAATKGDLDRVKWMQYLGANIHVRDDKALREAASHGHADVALYILGFDGVKSTALTKTLLCACEQGHLDLVQAVQTYDMTHHKALQQNRTLLKDALDMTIYYDHPKVTKKLIQDHGAIDAEMLALTLPYAQKVGTPEMVELIDREIIAAARRKRRKDDLKLHEAAAQKQAAKAPPVTAAAPQPAPSAPWPTGPQQPVIHTHGRYAMLAPAAAPVEPAPEHPATKAAGPVSDSCTAALAL